MDSEQKLRVRAMELAVGVSPAVYSHDPERIVPLAEAILAFLKAESRHVGKAAA